ncbi:MAG: hypothetical protein ABI301_05840, partial [Jatrophihabitantaceae bacterium]
MVLIGLLLLALVCLALGLVLASPGWLIASLAVTAVAAYVMWTKRSELSTRTKAAAPARATAPTPVQSPVPVATAAAEHETVPADGDVWVIDGRPNYHRQSCARLVGTDAESIAFKQASEDGFTPCPDCSSIPVPVAAVPPPPPRAAPLPAAAPVPLPAAAPAPT